jgi:hypothetical protein
MARPSPLRAFVQTASKEPRPWLKAVAVVLAVGLSIAMGLKRGWAVGLAAGVLYTGMLVGVALARDRFIAWSRRHPVGDSMFLAPLTFFALAYITTLSLAFCAAVAVCAWAVLAGLAGWLRQSLRVTLER